MEKGKVKFCGYYHYQDEHLEVMAANTYDFSTGKVGYVMKMIIDGKKVISSESHIRYASEAEAKKASTFNMKSWAERANGKAWLHRCRSSRTIEAYQLMYENRYTIKQILNDFREQVKKQNKENEGE